MSAVEYLEESAEPLSFSSTYESMEKLQSYMGKVGVNETYKELYDSYEVSTRNPEQYDAAFYAVGNKLHEEHEDAAVFWVNLLFYQRRLAVSASAFRRSKAFPSRRQHTDYRSGFDYPQDLFVND